MIDSVPGFTERLPGEAKAEPGEPGAGTAVERFDPDGWKQPEGEWIPSGTAAARKAKADRVESKAQDGSNDLGVVAKAPLRASESPFRDSGSGGVTPAAYRTPACGWFGKSYREPWTFLFGLTKPTITVAVPSAAPAAAPS